MSSIDTNQRPILSQLPSDLLLFGVAAFLRQRDQYILFSSCKTWNPLLQESRTVLLSRSIPEKTIFAEFLQTKPGILSWNRFRDNLSYRRDILTLLGYGDTPTITNLHRRKLHLRLLDDSRHTYIAVKDLNLIAKYVDYFYRIELYQQHSNQDDDEAVGYWPENEVMYNETTLLLENPVMQSLPNIAACLNLSVQQWPLLSTLLTHSQVNSEALPQLNS